MNAGNRITIPSTRVYTFSGRYRELPRVGSRMMTGLEQVLHLYRDVFKQSMTLQTEIDKRGLSAGCWRKPGLISA